ncbi:MAG TPA: TonB-dependent receptor plug domain-containing protein, partial [Desulfobacteria bacterium]|nr:TonB-dependent receptor plug domain-containing protein [Desulfobacteria bacterium]
MKNVRWCVLLWVFVTWAFPCPGTAEEPKAEETTAEEPAAKKVHRMDEMVVTATNYEASIKDIPSNVTVISGEEIQAQYLPDNDIGDALRNIAGVTTRRAYAPFPAYINIRGVGSNGTVILVNNIPTNWEIIQAIPPENIERVEIVRGPASALYGANASGGVVNIITKEGGEGINGTVGGGYGTFNTWRAQATSNGTVDKFHYSFAGYKDKSDGTNIVNNTVLPSVTMIEDCSYDKWAASLTAAYDLNEKGKLSFLFNFFQDEY